MAALRFADLARAFVGTASRRTTLGLGAAGLLGTLGLDDAGAKKHRKKKQCKKKCGPCAKCQQGKCKPKAAGTPCGTGKQCFAKGKCVACDVCASGCPHETLQAAVGAASDGETIHLCSGTYPSNATIVDKKLTVIGAGSGPGGTTLNGGGPGPVIRVDGGTVTLRALRLSGGHAEFGGGILNDEGTLTLSDCVVSDNAAVVFGGGIFSFGPLILTDCDVSGNSAGAEGGGIYSRGTLTVTDSTVNGNEAGNNGGGILNFDNTLSLNDSTVSENVAHANGGGIYNFGSGTTTLDAPSRVTGNTALTDGGGIYNNGGTVTLASAANVSGNTPDDCAGDNVPLCAEEE